MLGVNDNHLEQRSLLQWAKLGAEYVTTSNVARHSALYTIPRTFVPHRIPRISDSPTFPTSRILHDLRMAYSVARNKTLLSMIFTRF